MYVTVINDKAIGSKKLHGVLPEAIKCFKAAFIEGLLHVTGDAELTAGLCGGEAAPS